MNPSKTLAIVASPAMGKSFCERVLSAELEIGGEIHLIVRRDSIAGCLQGLIAAAPAYDYERECSIQVTLRYWELDDDLDDLEIKVMATDSDAANRPVSISTSVRILCTRAKVKFAQALRFQGITLLGMEGALQ